MIDNNKLLSVVAKYYRPGVDDDTVSRSLEVYSFSHSVNILKAAVASGIYTNYWPGMDTVVQRFGDITDHSQLKPIIAECQQAFAMQVSEERRFAPGSTDFAAFLMWWGLNVDYFIGPGMAGTLYEHAATGDDLSDDGYNLMADIYWKLNLKLKPSEIAFHDAVVATIR